VTDTLILCYHAIASGWKDPVAVSEARFASQVGLLRRLGYRGVTFSDAVLGEAEGRRVAVTFDDAFRSVLERALPVLDAAGWPGTVFAVTGHAEDGAPAAWPRLDVWLGTPHEAELATLDWDGLARLRDAGWEVGSHTVSHPHLTALAPGEMAAELTRSRDAVIARLGSCASLAYPYGDVNEEVVDAAREAGYDAAAALPARLHEARSHEWPRVGIYNVDRLPRFMTKIVSVRRP
jgi:peptidoglycan/xylan/chitin deacetylase (PgdA/CDA1 family)